MDFHIIGIGLDGDSHVRITKADHLTVLGGTKESHERMQEMGIKAVERIRRRGRHPSEMSRQELVDVFNE